MFMDLNKVLTLNYIVYLDVLVSRSLDSENPDVIWSW